MRLRYIEGGPLRLRYIEGIPGNLDLEEWTDLSSMEQFTLTVIRGHLEMPGVLIDDEHGLAELIGYDGVYYHREGWAAVMLSNGKHHVIGTNYNETFMEQKRFNRESFRLGTHERVVLVEARDDVACWGCRSAMRDPYRRQSGTLQVGWVDKDEGPFAVYHDRCKGKVPFGHRLVPHKRDTNGVIGHCNECRGVIKRGDSYLRPNRAMGHKDIYHDYCM